MESANSDGPRISSSAPAVPQIRAAEYVRMSTEHQQYSTENQRDIIRQYAQRRGMVVTRSYEDAGKSGLRIEGRNALKQLIKDVENRQVDFTVILVYDVSRWGRFQDADESVYYDTSAGGRTSKSIIVRNPSKMTAVLLRPSSRASSALWPASTAENCRARHSLECAGLSSTAIVKVAPLELDCDGCWWTRMELTRVC